MQCETENKAIYNQKLVVDGYIEENEVARVILSKNIPLNIILNRDNIEQFYVRNAKITLSDGFNSEVLSLTAAPGLVPPFVYKGQTIIGQAGKTYDLKIEYLNQILNSQTIIPKSIVINALKSEKISDEKGRINVQFTDDVSKNYYQTLTKTKGQDSLFVPTLYGNLDDINFNSNNVDVAILQGIKFFPEQEFDTSFATNKVIEVKLRTMNKSTFDFWNSFQNEILNGQNPLFPASENLKSNINGGYGNWAGYGSDVKTILIY